MGPPRKPRLAGRAADGTMPPMTELPARAEFSYTLADLADVSWRAAKHSPTFRRQQTWTALVLGLTAGGLVVAALALTRDERSPALLLGAGAATAVVFMLWRTLRLPSLYRRAVTRIARERHGDGPFACVVELHEHHVALQQPGLELKFAWPEVLAITADGDDLELRARRGVMVVRGRAFANAAAREQFVGTARRLQHAARAGIS